MPDPRRMTERDLMTAIYESVTASKDQAREDNRRNQYLLIAVLGGLGAREFLHTDPVVVSSFMYGVVASIFALLVSIGRRRRAPPESQILLLSVAVAFIVGTVASLGVDGHLLYVFAITRDGVASALLFYGLKVRAVAVPKIEGEAAP